MVQYIDHMYIKSINIINSRKDNFLSLSTVYFVDWLVYSKILILYTAKNLQKLNYVWVVNTEICNKLLHLEKIGWQNSDKMRLKIDWWATENNEIIIIINRNQV